MSNADPKFDSVGAFAQLLAELADPFGDEAVTLGRHGLDAEGLRSLKEHWRDSLAAPGPQHSALASQFTRAFEAARAKLAARPEEKPGLAREAARVPLSPSGESRPPPLLRGDASDNRQVRRTPIETEEVQFVHPMRLPFVPPLQRLQTDDLVDDDNATLPIDGPNARRVLTRSEVDELGANTVPGDAGPLTPALPFQPIPEKKP